MKLKILLVIILSSTLMLQAQVSKTIYVNAGGLSAALTTAEKNTLNILRIYGTIDARDFKTMRDNMPLLGEVDLSSVNIAAYSGSGGTSGSFTNYPQNTIPEYAFSNSNSSLGGKLSLVSIVLPSSVTSIGRFAFGSCKALAMVYSSGSVTTIGEYAFYYCSSLAFSSLQEGLITIGDAAFIGCIKLSFIFIPSSVITIGSNAFRGCDGFVTVSATNPNYSGIDGVLFNKDQTTMIHCPISKTGAYIIPSTVTLIDKCAFYDCTRITSVAIPPSVTTIGGYAFYNCSGLTGTLTIGQSVSLIDYNVFGGCNNIDSIFIPSSVTYIKNWAFFDCSGLIIVDAGNPKYSGFGGVLFNKTRDTLIHCPTSITGSYMIPKSVTAISGAAFGKSVDLNSVIIPPSVTAIGNSAFYYCRNLTSIYVQSSFPVFLGQGNVFYEVDKTSCALHVPYKAAGIYKAEMGWGDFTQIVEDTLGFWLGVNPVYLSAGGESVIVEVKANVEWAVASTSQWLAVSPVSGTDDGSLIFTAEANPLTTVRRESVTISSTGLPSQTINVVQEIPDKTLDIAAGTLSSTLTVNEKNNISHIKITGSIDARDFKIMRDNMPLLKDIDLSNATIVTYTGTEGTGGTSSKSYPANTIPERAFENQSAMIKSKLESIILPASITSIGFVAFNSCNSLTGTFSIPPLVTSIDSYAFQGCNSLASVSIPGTVTYIGSGAFQGCSGLITVDESSTKYSSADGVLFDKMKTTLIQCPVSKTGVYIIPSTIKTIFDQSFKRCIKLTSISFPSSVTTFKDASFQDCLGLTTISIPSSVTTIHNLAFYGCKNLSSIFAFAVSPVDLTSSQSIFLNVDKATCILYVPKGSVSLYTAANQWKDFAIIKEIPEITLNSGWNIFSTYLIPSCSDIKVNFQSLIDDGLLVKIQDEDGKAFEDYGIFGGWTNNIGDLKLTEGYKIKVTDNCQVAITGESATFPFYIPLKAGWNIISYPYINESEGLLVVQQLIDRRTLIKVQDKYGKSIEDLGVFGGWTNNIGTFKPGEGYKIKVIKNDTLAILKHGQAFIDEKGGQIVSEDKNIIVIIPPNTFDQNTAVTISKIPKDTSALVKYNKLGDSYKIEPSGVSFNNPVTVLWNYTDQLGNFDNTDNLGIIHEGLENRLIEVIPSKNDKIYHVLEFELDHFSIVTLTSFDNTWAVFNFHWIIEKIKWYIDESPENEYTTESNISTALQMWEDHTSSFVFERTFNINDANLIFKETNKISDVETALLDIKNIFIFHAAGGLCTFRYSEIFTLDKTFGKNDWCTIYVSRDNIKNATETYQNLCAQNVIAHEVGHALGIAHSQMDQPKISPIMYNKIVSYRNNLHRWDIEALDYHYDLKNNFEAESFTDSRDGHPYNTVKIGDQWWMSQNLAFLPSVSPLANGSETEPHYYVYDYNGTDVDIAKNTDNYGTYGVLYNRPAALSSCPAGWHLPNFAEWGVLLGYLGGGLEAGGKMKSVTGWNSPNVGATNSSGFSGLPGGERSPEYFGNIGRIGEFWTPYINDDGLNPISYEALVLGNHRADVCGFQRDAEDGMSVRCVKGDIPIPTVTTSVPEAITTASVLAGGTISEDSREVTERGICYDVNEKPTISDNKLVLGSGTGSYTGTITGLTANITYYVRAYAVNRQGISYGYDKHFTTSSGITGTFTDSRDGTNYNYIQIGKQVWMSQNLTYFPSNSNVSPPSVGSVNEPYYYVYGYSGTNKAEAMGTDNYKTYGVLYNWPAAMQGASGSSDFPSKVKGICPSGWHLPSEKEWEQLGVVLGMNPGESYFSSTNQGTQLKNTTGWNNNGNGDNSSGFSGLPGGYRSYYGQNFGSVGITGFWWSATGYETASTRALSSNSTKFDPSSGHKDDGFSIRCLKD